MKFDKNAKGEFKLIPVGFYDVQVNDIEPEKTSEKGNNYCNISFSIVGGDYNGRYVFDVFMYDDRWGWKWKNLFLAAGLDIEQLDGEEINSFTLGADIGGLLLHKNLKISVDHVRGQDGETRAKIGKYIYKKISEENNKKQEKKTGFLGKKKKGKEDDGFK